MRLHDVAFVVRTTGMALIVTATTTTLLPRRYLLESSMFESHDGVRASYRIRRSGLMKFSRALRQKGIASISVHAGEGKSA
jgi:hypothetical protein